MLRFLQISSIVLSHLPKKRRERLKWFFTVNGPSGPEERFMFRRDPCNDNRKQAIVNEMVKSLESKGLIADARGKCWLIDRADNESRLGDCFIVMYFYVIGQGN